MKPAALGRVTLSSKKKNVLYMRAIFYIYYKSGQLAFYSRPAINERAKYFMGQWRFWHYLLYSSDGSCHWTDFDLKDLFHMLLLSCRLMLIDSELFVWAIQKIYENNKQTFHNLISLQTWKRRHLLFGYHTQLCFCSIRAKLFTIMNSARHHRIGVFLSP